MTGATGATAVKVVAVARNIGSGSAIVHMAKGMTNARGRQRALRVVTAMLAQTDPLMMT